MDDTGTFEFFVLLCDMRENFPLFTICHWKEPTQLYTFQALNQ